MLGKSDECEGGVCGHSAYCRHCCYHLGTSRDKFAVFLLCCLTPACGGEDHKGGSRWKSVYCVHKVHGSVRGDGCG
jgi:hypothetical protein